MKKTIVTLLCLAPYLLEAQNYLDRYLVDSLTYTVVGSSANQLNAPRDLDVKPGTNEIWVGNYGTTSGSNFVIFYNDVPALEIAEHKIGVPGSCEVRT